MNPLRQRLKLETAVVHQQLHRLAVSKKILAGNISILEYAQYLEAHRYFYQTLDNHFYKDESGLIAHSGCFADWLESDLNDMGRECKRPNHSLIYEGFRSTVHQSLAAELGYAYVKYGSMFGAGVLLNALQKKVIHSARNAPVLSTPSIIYLSNAVANQKGFWERFELALCEYVRHEEVGDQVVQSAIKSFEMMFGLLDDLTVNTPAHSQHDQVVIMV